MEQAASTAGLELREPYVSSFSRQACYPLRYYKGLDMNVKSLPEASHVLRRRPP